MSTMEGEDEGNAATLRRRCAESYVEAWRQMARLTGGTVEEADGATRVTTAMTGPDFNLMFITEPPRDPEGVLHAARSFFAKQGVLWKMIIVEHGAGAASRAPLEEAAEAAGIDMESSDPGMVLAPIPAAEKPCPEELSIESIKTPEDLAVYANTMSEGFEMDPALLAPLNHPRTLRALDLKRYLGRVRGEPVATALRATVNRVAVLFNIVTLAPWRRRGFGEAITLRAAQEGLAEGCVASFLQSTMMGFPVYFRAGYRHVIDFHGWIPRGSRQS